MVMVRLRGMNEVGSLAPAAAARLSANSNCLKEEVSTVVSV